MLNLAFGERKQSNKMDLVILLGFLFFFEVCEMGVT